MLGYFGVSKLLRSLPLTTGPLTYVRDRFACTYTRGTLVCRLIPGTFVNTAQNWTGDLWERTQSLARDDTHRLSRASDLAQSSGTVKVEVAVLGSPSLIVLVVSMGVMQHRTVVSQSSGTV